MCVRHPDRATGLRCVRCDRPACPQCLREASVGYQCVDCVSEGRRTQRYGTTVAGALPGAREVVVPVLIAINVLVYAVTVVQAPLFQQWALSPSSVAEGQVWRLVTSGFLHVSLVHLAFNMLALWVIGRDLELILGRGRFIAVYLVALLGGSVAVYLFQEPESLTAGASGAVYGLMGGLAIVLVRLRRSPGPALGIIALNVVITFVVPDISVYGHFGGLVIGCLAMVAMVYAPPQRRTLVQASAVGALTAALVLLLVLF